ncbi:MAG: NAD(P)-dependent oxidoreductase [Spirosomataceae bacterium]
MKKILVTGGAGFIGSAIIKVLQKADHQIFVIDNLSFGNRDFISIPDSHFFAVDILDSSAIQKIIKTIAPDWVIHLAAVHFIPYCNSHPFEASNVNLRGTLNVLEALKETKPEKILFASTAAVYPISQKTFCESDPAEPVDIYGLSKYIGEQMMHKFYLETSLPTLVCRFSNAIGPNETNPHLFPEILTQIHSGKRTLYLGNLSPKRDYIHVFDIAEAVYSLMLQCNKGYETVNIGSGATYSVAEIVSAFEKVLGEKITVEIDPAKVRKAERMNLAVDISKLSSLLHRKPSYTLEASIAEILKHEEQKI